MTITSPTVTVAVIVVIVVTFSSTVVNGIGSASTIAITDDSRTVCGIVAEQSSQRIECYRGNETISIEPNISYEAISGGQSFFCGLISGGFSLLCWDTGFSNTSFKPKRIYYSATVRLTDLTVGVDHICAIENGTGVSLCWRGHRFPAPDKYEHFLSITSGRGFSCGILRNDSAVQCWGRRTIGAEIQRQFGSISMSTLIAGDSHACGLNKTGFLICKGLNDSGQLEIPSGLVSYGFSVLALGLNYSCGIRRFDGSVICWGGGREDLSGNVVQGVSFESIVAGMNFICGLTTLNLSVICWGPGWSSNTISGMSLPLSKIVPGPCGTVSCDNCGIYADSQTLCSGSGYICKRCEIPLAAPLPPSPPSSNWKSRRALLVFAIIGSVGTFSGFCAIIYTIWNGIYCCKHQKIHNSVQPNIGGGNVTTAQRANSNGFSPPSKSSTLKHQRSGTSSKHTDTAAEFSFAELAEATNNFSLENKVGAGSFGTVYRGKLTDGQEVAIKRGETCPKKNKYQEKESAFESELAFLSRLHHKHLVRLVGFCEERDERLLVYEYMTNGALFNHLHPNDNIEKSSSFLNSWKMRIKIVLDAARGIEYLHNYAVPPIIHRDIKSSNILLDANWTARVSDFGLSLMCPITHVEYTSRKAAAGTVGYMDPEYYRLNVLTSKSDVYGFGVVLLEVLTGKRAIFKDEENRVTSVVDFAVPMILAGGGELGKVLDSRVAPPEMKETQAVELVAYTAMHCVNLEGKERPTMTDIVDNLERALSLFDDSHGSISSASFSIASE